ncbi:MAG: hypothetical protein H8E84_01450 [Flavobacteriales bacterium]|nr:hypothetical protein [Flavobacteriales bacterium]
MKKQLKQLGMIAMAICTLSSCKKDTPTTSVTEGNYEHGYFVTNEGGFGSGNGSISFISNDNTVENNVFASINSFLLGDVVQSMNIINDKAYIVVNNSYKIEVANIDSMTHVASIEGGHFQSPRYILQVDENKAYVSDWGGGFGGAIVIIDLDSNIQTDLIYNGGSPEGLVKSGDKVFTADGGYGWSGSAPRVSVISTITDEIESTIDVGDVPRSIQVDANGDVWVLCEGKTEYDADWNIVGHTAGQLVKINGTTAQIEETFIFADSTQHPSNLVINDAGTTLYFSNGGWAKAVYAFDIADTQLPTTALINKSFYGLGCNGGYIYGTDAVDFVQNGWSYRYTTSGAIVDSVQVGIIPGGYSFN